MVLVQGLGLFASGSTWADADTARLVYIDAIKVMAGARRMGGVQYFRTTSQFHRALGSGVLPPSREGGRRRHRRVAGKVAVVTGAAQGFGLEIAQDLAEQGAHVVLTDVNDAGARRRPRPQHGAVRAGPWLTINVTDGESVRTAVHQAVRAFGGFDLFVSNAGVLKAGSVKTQSEKDSSFRTAVNYKGYFLCVQKAAPILSVQHLAKPGLWSDIIQINSKSGLQGSNQNLPTPAASSAVSA